MGMKILLDWSPNSNARTGAHPTAGEAHQPRPVRGWRDEAQLHPDGRRRGKERRAARRKDLQTQVSEISVSAQSGLTHLLAK